MNKTMIEQSNTVAYAVKSQLTDNTVETMTIELEPKTRHNWISAAYHNFAKQMQLSDNDAHMNYYIDMI